MNEVDAALESLTERADEVGKPLGNKRQINLTGTKEKKLRSSGIRIIYRITNKRVDILAIVEILLIDYKRDETTLYQEAELRYQEAIKSNDELDLGLIWNQPSTDHLNQLSMIDQIFDENFDSIDAEAKEEILNNYSHGNVEEAFNLWLRFRK